MTLAPSPLQILLQAFPGISTPEAEELVSSGKVCAYLPGAILCHEGALETTFYIILDGRVQVSKAISFEEARLLTTLGAGYFFGEMALIHGAPRAATVTTLAHTTVLEIDKEAFDSLLKNNASISLAMVRQASSRLRANDEMAIEDLRLKAGELALSYQRLAEQDYARREFLTTIAHELRTPLTASSGYLQMMELGLLQGDDFDTALESVTRNVQQIVSLVNDLLFLQEMDLIVLRSVPTALNPVLHASLKTNRRKAEANGVTLRAHLPEGLGLVSGEARSLERAFNAILDNAIKFSPDGGEVAVCMDRAGSEVRVAITDQGVGIPPEMLPRIFDRFFHIDQINGRLFRGAGLGLSIARHVIEQHQGKINVDSQINLGTRVTVFLPTLG